MGRGPEPPEYEFTDSSLVRPVATRVYFLRMFRLVPRWLTADFITLLGFGATVGMFLLALFSTSVAPGTLAAASFVALQAYVMADHLDGMQALAAGTGSPLGEFLDHFSDCVSGAFVAFVCLELMPGLGEGVRASLLWLYLLAFIATYQERAEARRLHFARFGALEGIVILSVFLATSALPAGRAFWETPLRWGPPGYWVLVAIAYAAFGGTVATILVRMRKAPASFVLHAAASATLALAGTKGVGSGVLDSWLAWALVSAHGAGYLATVMQPHLFGGRPRVDFPALLLAAGLVLALAAGDFRWTQGVALATLAYLVLGATRSVYGVLHAYRHAWVWVNPDR